MAKQYELWGELEDGHIGRDEFGSIDDAIQSSQAPDSIKDSISDLARSMRRQSPKEVSLIPSEDSVLNYDPQDRLDIMKDRINLHLGHSTEGMSVKQIYGKYFSTLESEKYRKKE